MPEPLRLRLARRLAPERFAAVSVRVDDSDGWGSLTYRGQDYDPAKIQENYSNALIAWRKNPIAWRIIAITTDYVLGDGITITSPRRALRTFITDFWSDPMNRMDMRLESLCDELSRAGDLFLTLHRNERNGMSYLRVVPKENIVQIESLPEDWEVETVYHERIEGTTATRQWLSPRAEGSETADAVMLHYAVNRPVGALLGESDLVTLTPWMQRYSQMLEDRVNLHNATRAFLWDVVVPETKVAAKAQEYRSAPTSGQVMVHDQAETWTAIAPTLHGQDAQYDLKSVRGMIDAGSGYPPHWRGESGDANLATATAMQGPTERHLKRRQLYVAYMLQDVLATAYRRAVEIGMQPPLKDTDYTKLFTVQLPDISRSDNAALAAATGQITTAVAGMTELQHIPSATLRDLSLRLILKFAGETVEEEQIQQILAEMPYEKPAAPMVGAGSPRPASRPPMTTPDPQPAQPKPKEPPQP